MPELGKSSAFYLVQPDIPRTPKFSILTNPAEARRWMMRLSSQFAPWRQRRMGWGDVDHACVLYGRHDNDNDAPLGDSVAARLGIDHVRVSAADWCADPYVMTVVAAMVRIFDEAASRAPCVLSLDDLHSFPGQAIARSPFARVATLAFLSELDDALTVPGLVIIVTNAESVALAQVLFAPACAKRTLAVPVSGIARPANDNAPRTADQPRRARRLSRGS